MDAAQKRFRFRIVIPAFPAFNVYSRIAGKTTALGPVCIATAANKLEKWDVEVIDENNLGALGPGGNLGADHTLLEKLQRADVVGFYGGLTSTIPRLYELARYYRAKGAITVGGGQHFVGDNITEALHSGLDYVVIGEGEETIKELLRALESQVPVDSVNGIALLRDGAPFLTAPRPPVTDFDAVPQPDFSLVRYANLSIYPVEMTRGCGMDCEFCTVRGKPRFAGVERVLAQIRILAESRNARCFFFVDDLFGQQRDETLRLCEMLYEYQRRICRRLEFTVQIRLDKARDTALLTAMRQAGIRYVAIGFESPIENELTMMHKHLRSEQMLGYTRTFRQLRFIVHGMFIFGYPLDAPGAVTLSARERVRQFRSFIKKAKIDTIQVLLPVPLPGTQLRSRLQREGRVYPLEDVGWEYYDGNFPLFEPDAPMTAEQLQPAIRAVMGKCYRFGSLFSIIASLLSFPAFFFLPHRIRAGWNNWYRHWRNSVVRFGGWMIMNKWATQFDQGLFIQKLRNARVHLQPKHM